MFIWPFLFCFGPKTVHGTNFFELFAKLFRIFRPRGNFFDVPKFFQNLADSAAIRLVQKSSKSEPPWRFFSHLKFRKSLPVSVLPKFPRQIQNKNGHMGMRMAKKSLTIKTFTFPQPKLSHVGNIECQNVTFPQPKLRP